MSNPAGMLSALKNRIAERRATDLRGSPPKEKGGAPEDARQKDQSMQGVLEMTAGSKKPRTIQSVNSPNKTAGLWLDEMIAKSALQVVTQVVDLTPALAQALLDRNQDNRKVSQITIDNYARDMSNGAWAFNGEPIIVSNTGKLNDGQHRCEAIVASGATIPCVMVIGPDRNSRLTVDQGKIRTGADYLAMEGHVDAAALAAAANYIWQHINHGFIGNSSHFRPTKSELLSFVSEHPNIIDSLGAVQAKGSDAVGGRAILTFAHWTFSRASGNRTNADHFVEALINGSNLVPRSPILYARNRLMAERGRLRANEKAELIIRSWNASRRGDKVAQLPIKGGALPTVER